MKVRQWAVLTSALYALSIVVLTGPALVLAFASHTPDDAVRWREVAEIYHKWQYWLGVAVLGGIEALLLLVPIEIARGRPVSRSRWTTLAVIAGLMMTLLLLGLAAAVSEAVRGASWLEGSRGTFWFPLIGFGGWAFWSVFFWVCSRLAPDSALRKTVGLLMKGSIAELLIAVPCHIYVRSKDYCCAGFGTFVGLATGLSVLLFSFGPGVFFLFVARARKLRAPATVPD